MRNRIDCWLMVLALLVLAALFVGDAQAGEPKVGKVGCVDTNDLAFTYDPCAPGGSWPTWYFKVGGTFVKREFGPGLGVIANWKRHGFDVTFGYVRIEEEVSAPARADTHDWQWGGWHDKPAAMMQGATVKDWDYAVGAYYVLRLN